MAGRFVREHQAVLELLTNWHGAEASWDRFLTKTLWPQFGSRSKVIASFMFGACGCEMCAAVPNSSDSHGGSLSQIPHTSSARAETTVIDGIEHIEPAAVIHPCEAEAVNLELEAGYVERNLAVGFLPDHANRDISVAEFCVVLLQFGRCPRELHEAILNSELALNLLSQGLDVRPSWASGSIVLADIPAYAVSEAQHRWHVAVREEDEQQVYLALRPLAHDVRPRLKCGDHGRFFVPNFTGASQSSSAIDTGALQGVPMVSKASGRDTEQDVTQEDDFGDLISQLVVQRTFIHYPTINSFSPRRTVSAP